MEAKKESHAEMLPYPSDGLLRFVFRAPIVGWRLGLGGLLGRLFVLITTWGRKTGKPRRTLTEYQSIYGKIYVPSAYGARSDWVQNINADPHVTLQTWQGPESMIATQVTDDEELRQVYHRFREDNQAMMDWYLQSKGIEPDDPDDYVAKKERVTIFRFDPTDEPTPPPLEADLVWVWPLALGVLLGAWGITRLLKRDE